MGLKERYLERAHGLKSLAAANLAADLMEGDAAAFKAGYTRENALIAAVELFGLDERAGERAAELLAELQPEGAK